ncbi:hypothetical protein DEJ48_36565 [Streptomyces venezuelae]|uniref:Uncharacterized protein n=1 Tax=Streptomyces venezuelae TaxID=54571 RepID=A0A5P2C6L3_STRVZ|nr:hypothetical protein [Streptomyces venezuelae]QES38203.1 hypothetical protein DEJ48_36565 [Streptomyces venezuelae]
MAKPLLCGRQEIGRVYRIKPEVISNTWIHRGVLSYEHAVIVSGKPVWPGGFVESLALPPGSRGRQLDAEELAALEAEQGARVRPRKKGELPPLVGAQEYAELFGVTQVAVGQAAKAGSGRVAEPDYALSGSKVWLLESVLAHAPTTMEKSRKKIWVLREDVAEALEQGRYDGPGSFFSQRGNKVQ